MNNTAQAVRRARAYLWIILAAAIAAYLAGPDCKPDAVLCDATVSGLVMG